MKRAILAHPRQTLSHALSGVGVCFWPKVGALRAASRSGWYQRPLPTQSGHRFVESAAASAHRGLNMRYGLP